MMKVLTIAALIASAMATTADAQQMLGREGTTWRWDGAVAAGQWARINNVNGGITVTASPDSRVHVVADKRVHDGGDPTSVHYAVVQSSRGVTICALWNDNATCDEDGSHQNNSHGDGYDRRRNVSVEFQVQLPSGVNTGVNTVNGTVNVSSVTGQVQANTVNGTVSVDTRGGPVSAHTVNGNIHASMGAQGTSDMSFGTVNGSIDITGPQTLNADVDFSTVTGGIETRYPLTITGRWGPKHARGTIGRGGPELRAETVNGRITLR